MTWHFVHVHCSRGHVMIGNLYACGTAADVDAAKVAFSNFRAAGQRSGVFTGACGRCGCRELSINDLDTGEQTERGAALVVTRLIELWRSDQLD